MKFFYKHNAKEQTVVYLIGLRMNQLIHYCFCIFIAFQLTGCNKNNETNKISNPITLRDLKSTTEQNNKEFVKKIEDFLKYKNYNSKFECFINDESDYCFKVSSIIKNIENNKNYLYVVESGYPLDDEKELNQSHAASGSLRFLKYELNNEKLTLIAKSETINCGPYGSPCEPLTYKFGSTNELAWVAVTGDMHQGYEGSSLSIYSVINDKIKEILELPTSYSNSGAIDEDDKISEIISIDLKIITAPQENIKYFDLDVTVTGEITKAKKVKSINSRHLLKYDDKKNLYDAQQIKKIFEGF